MISQSMPAPVFQMKMSEDELAFVNVQDDVDDDADDDAFTTEEELCLSQSSVVCVMCPHLMFPYLVCFLSLFNVIIS